ASVLPVFAPGAGAPTTEFGGSCSRRSTASGANGVHSTPNADYPESHPGRVLLHRSLQVAVPVGAPPPVRTARAARPMRIAPIAPGAGAPTTELAGSYACRSTAFGANGARSTPNADYPQSHPGRVLLQRSLQVAV